MTAVSSGPEASRWEKVIAIAAANGVSAPQPTEGHARATDRAQRAAQKKKGPVDRLPRAHEVQVEHGFFVNEDNTPTNIIDHVSPGATGLVLVDFTEAAQLCSSLEKVQPDELAILVLGHACPDAHSCDGALSFPAESADGSRKVLLAGCLHNFGGKKVRGMHATKAEIELSDVTCCQFMVFSDEVEALQWKMCVDAPVRFVADILRCAGMTTSFSSPWGRSFAAKNRPSVPTLAESMTFHARVATDLQDLLKLSGQAGVYVTPKLWDRSPRPHYAVVWTGPVRAEAHTAALKVPEQMGIVRSKSSFGVRVPEDAYGKAC